MLAVDNAWTLAGGNGGVTFLFLDVDAAHVGRTCDLVTYAGTNFALGDLSYRGPAGFAGTFKLTAGAPRFQVTDVPEPAALALLAVGGVCFLRSRRRV